MTIGEKFGIESIRIESRLLPTLTYELKETEPGFLTKTAKPSVKAKVYGKDLILYEPFGPPEFSLLPLLADGFALLFVGVGYLLGR